MNDSRPTGSSVLLALVERRERVVSKRELMELVWPKLVVEENNLLVHMSGCAYGELPHGLGRAA